MVFLNLRRNWNSRFDKTLLVQISGQWPDADKTEEVATQNLCLFVATAILIIAMLQLPSCYCHFDCHVATAMVIIAVNFVDKPARLIMILVFILFANSSQFAATSFKSIFFSSTSSSRAKSIKGDGHDTTSSVYNASHARYWMWGQFVQFIHSQRQVQARAASPPSSSQMSFPGLYLPSWIMHWVSFKVSWIWSEDFICHHFYFNRFYPKFTPFLVPHIS